MQLCWGGTCAVVFVAIGAACVLMQLGLQRDTEIELKAKLARLTRDMAAADTYQHETKVGCGSGVGLGAIVVVGMVC